MCDLSTRSKHTCISTLFYTIVQLLKFKSAILSLTRNLATFTLIKMKYCDNYISLNKAPNFACVQLKRSKREVFLRCLFSFLQTNFETITIVNVSRFILCVSAPFLQNVRYFWKASINRLIKMCSKRDLRGTPWLFLQLFAICARQQWVTVGILMEFY